MTREHSDKHCSRCAELERELAEVKERLDVFIGGETIDQGIEPQPSFAPSSTTLTEAERLSEKWLSASPLVSIKCELAGALLRDALHPTSTVAPSAILRTEGWIRLGERPLPEDTPVFACGVDTKGKPMVRLSHIRSHDHRWADTIAPLSRVDFWKPVTLPEPITLDEWREQFDISREQPKEKS